MKKPRVSLKTNGQEAGNLRRVVIRPKKAGKILAGGEHKGIVRGNRMRVNNQFGGEKVYNEG